MPVGTPSASWLGSPDRRHGGGIAADEALVPAGSTADGDDAIECAALRPPRLLFQAPEVSTQVATIE
ncbi:hypothetical protein [Actinoallomurus sp. CA-142502]|uniref:hypothetical protein n=1 Tax=Actinoallomurus sp. CA-142502 TaxID=3239885 RepID=UPI003D919D59